MKAKCVKNVFEVAPPNPCPTLLIEEGEVLPITGVHTGWKKVILDGTLYFTPEQFKTHFVVLEEN